MSAVLSTATLRSKCIKSKIDQNVCFVEELPGTFSKAVLKFFSSAEGTRSNIITEFIRMLLIICCLLEKASPSLVILDSSTLPLWSTILLTRFAVIPTLSGPDAVITRYVSSECTLNTPKLIFRYSFLCE